MGQVRQNLVGERVKEARRKSRPPVTQQELSKRLSRLGVSIDRAGVELLSGDPAMNAITEQDEALARVLGGQSIAPASDPIDRLYAARDALLAALESGGPSADGARRALRLAIADDLRLAERLRGAQG